MVIRVIRVIRVVPARVNIQFNHVVFMKFVPCTVTVVEALTVLSLTILGL